MLVPKRVCRTSPQNNKVYSVHPPRSMLISLRCMLTLLGCKLITLGCMLVPLGGMLNPPRTLSGRGAGMNITAQRGPLSSPEVLDLQADLSRLYLMFCLEADTCRV